MSDKDKANLLAILDGCSKIQNFISDIWDADELFADQKTFDAVLMNFIIIGESVSRISYDLKAIEIEIPWNKIKDFRNIVAHDYFGVDAEEIWQIIHDDLPELVTKINKLVSN